jgi:lysophospholipid acyltransferase (LPLAT)-like uncharacterized protein
MDEDIRVPDSGVIMRWIRPPGPWIMGMNANPAEHRAELPNVGADHKLRTQRTAGLGRQDAGNATILQPLAFPPHRLPDSAQRTTGADRRSQFAFRDDQRSLAGHLGGDGGEGHLQIGKSAGEVLRAKPFQSLAMQQTRPEYLARQRRHGRPIQAGGDHRANQAAGTGSGNDGRPDAGLGENLDDADMRQSPHGPSAQSQSHTTGAELMHQQQKPTPQPPLYRADVGEEQHRFAAEIRRLADLHHAHTHVHTVSSSAPSRRGRNRVSQTIDAAIEFIRRYLPPLHWLLTRFLALLLYGYAFAVGTTARIVTVGSFQWPDIPRGAVLAIWHGSAPSLLAVFAGRKPVIPVTLMVSRDGRGDCVAVFCRWLGFDIVRGDAQHGGWRALFEIANKVHSGGAAIISPDGGGPALLASVGAVAVASAAGVPVIPVGTDCSPSLFQRRKWDAARSPLPFGRIAVACGGPLQFPSLEDADSLERARGQLQDALNREADVARGAFDRPLGS